MATLAQRVASNTAIYGFSRVAHNVVGFLLIPIYARYLGDQGYGTVTLLHTLATLLHIVFSQGLHESWSRLRFHYPPEERRAFESTIFWYLVASCGLLVSGLMLVGPALAPRVTPGVPFFPLGALAVVGGVLLMPGMFFARKTQAEERTGAFTVFALLRSVLVPAAIILFVVGLGRGVQGKLEADLVSGAILTLLVLVWSRPLPPGAMSRRHLRDALVFGLPLLPHSVAWFANSFIDRMLVNAYLGLGATGVYGMGYKIASASEMVSGVMSVALIPVLAGTLKDLDERPDLPAEERAQRLASLARDAIWLLAGEEFAASWTVVPLISFAVVLVALYRAFEGELLYDRRGSRLLGVVSILAAAVNVVANVVLLPMLGILGAAVASVVSNLVLAVGVLALRSRHARVPHRWGVWALVMALTALGLGGLWWLDLVMESQLPRLLSKLALAAVVGLAILRVARFRIRDVLDSVRSLRKRRAAGRA